MITSCPHCQTPLNFSDVQKSKLEKALKELLPGKKLNIKCPACKEAIVLGSAAQSGPAASAPAPPGAPDVSWLKDGKFEVEDKMEDVPRALILHPDMKAAKALKTSMETVGYQVMTAATVAEAMEKIYFFNFSCIVLHERFHSNSLEESEFHAYMRRMPMNRRRYIFYILIGQNLQTLYDMQALAMSANLVVAEKDLPHMDVILRKSIPDYEDLFGPLLEELSAYGKK